jgi:Ca-activated chloride channel family protein
VRVDRLALLLALWGAVVTAAPQQRVEPPVLFARTDLVTLAVSVVDHKGAFVPGLRQEQFTVYENGDQQTVQFFTRDEMPATIGLLLDSSTSMRGRREHVNAAAAALVELRHPLDELFTLHFNEAAWPGLPPGVDFTADGEQLRAALDAPSQGMTALYDALARGLAHVRKGTRDRKALIVISDGGDNASSHTLPTVVEHARQTGAVVYPVRFTDPDNRDARPQVLNTIARETGGRAFVVRDRDDVERAFASIAHEVRSAYTLGFSPSEPSNGSFHSIRVVVDAGRDRRLTARTRAGYYAAPPAK